MLTIKDLDTPGIESYDDFMRHELTGILRQQLGNIYDQQTDRAASYEFLVDHLDGVVQRGLDEISRRFGTQESTQNHAEERDQDQDLTEDDRPRTPPLDDAEDNNLNAGRPVASAVNPNQTVLDTEGTSTNEPPNVLPNLAIPEVYHFPPPFQVTAITTGGRGALRNEPSNSTPSVPPYDFFDHHGRVETIPSTQDPQDGNSHAGTSQASQTEASTSHARYEQQAGNHCELPETGSSYFQDSFPGGLLQDAEEVLNSNNSLMWDTQGASLSGFDLDPVWESGIDDPPGPFPGP